jgi:hypothetical protein
VCLLQIRSRVRIVPKLNQGASSKRNLVQKLNFSPYLSLKTIVVAVKLSLNTKVGPNLSNLGQCVNVTLLENWSTILWLNVNQQVFVVSERWTRNECHVSFVRLNDKLSYPLDTHWEQTKLVELFEPMSDLVADEGFYCTNVAL